MPQETGQDWILLVCGSGRKTDSRNTNQGRETKLQICDRLVDWFGVFNLEDFTAAFNSKAQNHNFIFGLNYVAVY